MFEQASIDNQGVLKSPWALMVSVTGQILVVSACVLASLIHTGSLPRAFLITRLSAPGAPAPPAVASSGSAVRQARPSPRALTMPLNVANLRNVEAHGAIPSLSLSAGDAADQLGVVGGIGDGPALPGVLGQVVHALPPPPAPPQEKASAIAPSKPMHVSQGVQAAKLIRQVKPAYPPLARQARIAGTVRLVAIIGRDGAIQNLQVSSGHPLLTPAAVEAVKQWRYQPTLLSGEPVEVITQIEVNFTLSN